MTWCCSRKSPKKILVTEPVGDHLLKTCLRAPSPGCAVSMWGGVASGSPDCVDPLIRA